LFSPENQRQSSHQDVHVQEQCHYDLKLPSMGIQLSEFPTQTTHKNMGCSCDACED